MKSAACLLLLVVQQKIAGYPVEIGTNVCIERTMLRKAESVLVRSAAVWCRQHRGANNGRAPNYAIKTLP